MKVTIIGCATLLINYPLITKSFIPCLHFPSNFEGLAAMNNYYILA